jgi:hypothetical protein
MIRLGISVEGQTESEFVTRVLTPQLLGLGIDTRSTIVQTKRLRDGTWYAGGSVSVERVRRQIRPLLHSFDFVSTLYDFYGFGDRLQGETVDSLEQRLGREVGAANFIPYVQRYEFESLLFGGKGILPAPFESPQASAEIAATVARFGDPELINDSIDTAPGRRLNALFLAHFGVNYDKIGFGPPWAGRIGLPLLRANCRRFGHWLHRLERLAEAPQVR